MCGVFVGGGGVKERGNSPVEHVFLGVIVIALVVDWHFDMYAQEGWCVCLCSYDHFSPGL